jgi:Protein of unknown function (DUF3485)
MQRILVLLSACAVLTASGVVHGVWTDRWSDQSDLADCAQRLEQFPMTVGDWHGTNVEMDKDPNTGLAGMIARRYVHATSGKVVTLFLACGRSGAVCTHTPEVCYAGSGYEVEKPKRFVLPSTTAQAPPEFWTARFVKERANGRTHLRIFWSWYGTESWKVADNPRLSFAGEKVLYKMYLIREMVQADEPIDGDACVEFMQDLLPVFRRSVALEVK